MKTTKTHRIKNATMSTSNFAPGAASSAGRMKMKTGVKLCATHHVVEGGRRITTAELLRSINDAADRFLRGDRPARNGNLVTS